MSTRGPGRSRCVTGVTAARLVPSALVVLLSIGAGRLAAQHLVDLGHRRIGLIAPAAGSQAQALRVRGFRETLARAGLPPGPAQAQFGPEGKRLRELARGQDDTPLYPRMMEENIEESVLLTSATVSLGASKTTMWYEPSR